MCLSFLLSIPSIYKSTALCACCQEQNEIFFRGCFLRTICGKLVLTMGMTREEFVQKRTELGMTQPQLAEALGLSLRAVQYYEGHEEREVPKPVERLLATLKPLRKKRKREVE